MFWPLSSYGADFTLKWDTSAGAVGYRIYRSEDGGANWTELPRADYATTEETLSGEVEDKMIIYRVSAYNGQGDAINYNSGAWFNGLWSPPATPMGVGIE